MMAFALFPYHLGRCKPLEYAAFSWQPLKLAALTLLERKTFFTGEQRDVRAWCAQSLAEAEQGAQLLPGEGDKKS